MEAKALVFATGYELADGVPPTDIYGFRPGHLPPRRSRRFGASPELIWEASKPHLYLRSTSDGRLVVGGEDEDVTDEESVTR